MIAKILLLMLAVLFAGASCSTPTSQPIPLSPIVEGLSAAVTRSPEAAETAPPTRLVTVSPPTGLPTIKGDIYDNSLSASYPATATAAVVARLDPGYGSKRGPLPTLRGDIYNNVLSTAVGAGGDYCPDPDLEPNAIQFYGGRDEQVIGGCFWLKGIDISQPFKVILSQPGSPNIPPVVSPDLRVDLKNKAILWEGYEKIVHNGHIEYRDGVLAVYDIAFWSPTRFASGTVRFTIVQPGSSFGEFWQEYEVNFGTGAPYLNTTGVRPTTELYPADHFDGKVYFYHRILTDPNGQVTVSGGNYPQNQLIPILVYRRSPGGGDMELVKKLTAPSDRTGKFKIEFDFPFDIGSQYLILGLSDPNTPLVKEDGLFYYDFPYDIFDIVSEAALPCPGAPTQRITVNQSGTVCTKHSTVHLRAGPYLSAYPFLDMLPGKTFSVVGGPACADNWSWWKIRTVDDYGNETDGWVAEGGDAVDPYFICPVP